MNDTDGTVENIKYDINNNSTDNSKKSKLRIIIFTIIPFILSAAVFIYFVKTKDVSSENDETTTIRKVRYMKATPVTVQKVAVGYGRIVPSSEWTGFSEVKGRIICVGCSLFRNADIRDPKQLASKLSSGTDPASSYIKNRLLNSTLNELSEFAQSFEMSDSLLEKLVFEFNFLIQESSLYSLPYFNVVLNPKMQLLAEKKVLRSDELIRLNRAVLEALFSNELSSSTYYNIEEGQFVPEGAVICQIDPTDYYLLIEQRSLVVEQNILQIKELNNELIHLKKIFELENKRAELFKTEYERKLAILKHQAFSASEVERELHNYLHQLNAIEEIANSIELIPMKIKNLDANTQQAESQLKQARLELKRTLLTAPFAMRISEENVELNQFVSHGQILVKGYGIDSAEVHANFLAKNLGNGLFDTNHKFDFLKFLNSGSKEYIEALNVQAIVNLSERSGVEQTEDVPVWRGKVSRLLSSINEVSQTVPVVVTVKNPYKDMILGSKPPLTKGRYCKVTLLGNKTAPKYCVSRTALHNNKVLIMKDGRLEIRDVKVDYFQEDYAVISDGINKGERIILSDVFPAVPNMKITGIDKTETVLSNYPWFVETMDD